MTVTVVNQHHAKGTHSIMRPGPLGNPFRVKPYGPYDRGEAVRKYRAWFMSPDPGAVTHRRIASSLPRDAVLECCCKPLACHGDVIAEYRNRLELEKSIGDTNASNLLKRT
jgi:hypothetical protein